MSTSVHADAPPEVVCDPEGLRYATGPQLGKGGFAICHRAELLDHGHLTNNVVALKIVKSKMDPPKLAQKFVTELQIHSKLAHPNIVEFYRAFSFEESTFVVLEICESGSLADAIKKRKYFTMPEIRRFMIQTCGAVKYLHHRNIVHRDLKTGNLFLDKNMNIKIGDFGLAALLVSADDLHGIRRTTMCGTPNYLAPEVLEKTGQGHNEKVDLWAIGIIMYTLAVGRAPFHAAKREEIYKKLKAREYSWPELSRFPNDISDDLRNVVGSLLVHEDDRPNPDKIVSHDFFRFGFIPLDLDSSYNSRVPTWPKIRPPTAATIKRGYTEEWFELCKASAVGEYAPGKIFGGYGSRRNKTVAKDCQKEIQSGKQPTIPFSKDTVYLPFPERTNWPHQGSNGLSEITEEKESSSEGQALVETRGNDNLKLQPPRRARKEGTPPLKENVEPTGEAELARRVVDKPTRIRSIRKISNPERLTAGSAPPVRAPRSQRTLQKTRSAKDVTKEDEPLADAQPLQTVKSLPTIQKEMTVSYSSETPPKPADAIPSANSSIVASTDPTMVLRRLTKLRDNISRALDKKPMEASKLESRQLPFVAKWVDYSGKYGVGYVLEDGSVGSIITATARHPVTIAVTRNGLACLRQVAKEAARITRIPLEFYADTTGKGLSLIEIANKDRRQQACSVWTKFGKYMCQQLGQQERAFMGDDKAPSNFVKFYQRLGNVGVWGFFDGSFQFNFPDHTKLVLSPDGTYCKFICLPAEAAKSLLETGNVSYKCIRNRQILYGSLQRLLYGSADASDSSADLTEANYLRKKLEFILSIVHGWVSGGGLGCLEQPRSFQWDGPELEDSSKKREWVTVGRFGGDVQ